MNVKFKNILGVSYVYYKKKFCSYWNYTVRNLFSSFLHMKQTLHTATS